MNGMPPIGSTKQHSNRKGNAANEVDETMLSDSSSATVNDRLAASVNELDRALFTKKGSTAANVCIV